MDDWKRETQPDGALTPPPRVPPVAVATAAPLPPPLPRHTRRVAWDLRGIVNRALDRLDSFGDDIASAMGIR